MAAHVIILCIIRVRVRARVPAQYTQVTIWYNTVQHASKLSDVGFDSAHNIAPNQIVTSPKITKLTI